MGKNGTDGGCAIGWCKALPVALYSFCGTHSDEWEKSEEKRRADANNGHPKWLVAFIERVSAKR